MLPVDGVRLDVTDFVNVFEYERDSAVVHAVVEFVRTLSSGGFIFHIGGALNLGFGHVGRKGLI